MSDELSRFLATKASPETRDAYTNRITNQLTVNHITVHVGGSNADSSNNKRRKTAAPAVEVDPSTFGAAFLTSTAIAILDKEKTALGEKTQFLYPTNTEFLAYCYEASRLQAANDVTKRTSATPDAFGNLILESAQAAKTGLPPKDKIILDQLRILSPSDPDTHADLFSTIWKFYTENPLALAAYTAHPDDRLRAVKAHRAFILPCPLCNPNCAALRDRLNTKDIEIPHRPSTNKRSSMTIHDNAVTKYLTIPNLLNHCRTLHSNNEPIMTLHRYLAKFFTLIDSEPLPLWAAVAQDYSNLPSEEVTEVEEPTANTTSTGLDADTNGNTNE